MCNSSLYGTLNFKTKNKNYIILTCQTKNVFNVHDMQLIDVNICKKLKELEIMTRKHKITETPSKYTCTYFSRS